MPAARRRKPPPGQPAGPRWTRRFPTPTTAATQVTRSHVAQSNQPAEPLPPPTGSPPYRLALSDVLKPEDMQAIEAAGHLRFHCVGDTGGINKPDPQAMVAHAMAGDLTAADPPRFFYHLGDVVYFYGEEAQYYPQFFEPYADYHAPIFAIPGNHDGGVAPGTNTPSLQAFVTHFCAPAPVLTPTAADVNRAAMDEPNVYWTFLHPWVTIVGLYTNVPDGGVLGSDQLRWLSQELAAAPKGVTLILALHHPVYSTDSTHGSNLALLPLLDAACEQANRAPDAVFTAHVHNYQRFTRTYQGRQIPYVVAGTGGYWHLHSVANGTPTVLPATFDGLPDVTLDKWQDKDYGYMTVTAGPGGAEVTYTSVNAAGAAEFDSFTITPA
jgi:hypothetical protein